MRGALAALLLLIAAPAFADSLLPPAEYANRQLADPRQEAQAKAIFSSFSPPMVSNACFTGRPPRRQ